MTQLVHFADYCPAGDQVTDDGLKLLQAIAACGNDGRVMLEGGKQYFLGDRNITLPEGVIIDNPGSMGGDNGYGQDWANMLGGFRIASGRQIIMHSRSGLRNLAVIPYGMTFPQSSCSGWTGTPLSTRTGYNEVDVDLDRVLVMGFAQAFDGINCPRLRMNHFEFDCKAGIVIDTAGDTIQLNYVRGWPWATVSGPNGNAGLTRPGIAMEFKNNTDGGLITNSFSTSYAVGVRVADLNGLRIHGHAVESPYLSGAIGYLIEGVAQNIELLGCQGNGLQNAVVANMSVFSNQVNVNGGLWGAQSDNHFRAFGGTLTVRNALMQSCNIHASAVGTNSRLILQNNNYLATQLLTTLYSGAQAAQVITANNVVI